MAKGDLGDFGDLREIRLPANPMRFVRSGVIILVVILLVATGFYTVGPEETGVITRFGAFERTTDPGLHFKLPVVNTVNFYPRRLLTIINPQEQFLTFEKKNLVVDFFVKWRIIDVSKYYRATGGEEIIAAQRLLEIVKDGIRGEFAKRTVPESEVHHFSHVADVEEAAERVGSLIQ